jgi:3-deoxy-manno-octulosonate cytidylyltransferase (CMP-KDO synthetase)
MGSTRFPGKPLVDLLGKPMLQWVVEASVAAGIADRVVVATPDQEILDACSTFDAEAILTSHEHPTGTDRIAEVSKTIVSDFYVNVQGDEPLIDPLTIATCARPLIGDHSIQMCSVFSPCPADERENPAVVKVVTDLDNFALYFSRFPLPFPRNVHGVETKKHVGIYAYRREVVQAFSTWDQTPLEKTESLEQLRFLEHGTKIKMAPGHGSELAVDTPEQAEEVRRILLARLGQGNPNRD